MEAGYKEETELVVQFLRQGSSHMDPGVCLWVIPHPYHLFAEKSLEKRGTGGINLLFLEIHVEIIKNYSMKILVLKDG